MRLLRTAGLTISDVALWHKALFRLVSNYDSVTARELDTQGYSALSPSQRTHILRLVLEAQLDFNVRHYPVRIASHSPPPPPP